MTSWARRTAFSILASCLGIGACSDEAPPRPQWVVSITTDAPVPQFGDRILVEILEASGKLACDGCQRTFGLDSATPMPLEFAIAPLDTSEARGVFVRARLFRAVSTSEDGAPRGGVIDALVELPRQGAIERVGFTLRMACYGIDANVAAMQSCDASKARLTAVRTIGLDAGDFAARPGDWAPAKAIDCPRAAPSRTVCVPGGAMAMGDARGLSVFDIKALPQRLVVVSPFALDEDEVTVGEVRRVRGALAVFGAETRTKDAACTYIDDDDPANDALPMNCIDFPTASAVCQARGMRLPTEAEWEYAAGNTSKETRFPWGDDQSVACDRAILARGRIPTEGVTDTSYACRVPREGALRPWGPAAGGSDGDKTDQGVKNLAGNVAEWVEDVLATYDSDCWSASSPLVDPLCKTGEDLRKHGVRGGSWQSQPNFGFASGRGGATDGVIDSALGFRCAKSF